MGYIWNMWINKNYSFSMYSFVGKMLNVAAFWLKPANLSCMIQSCISVNAGSGIVLQRELTNESRRNQSLVPRVQFWSTRWEFLAFVGLQVMPCMAVVSILQMLPANAISTHAISMSVWVPKRQAATCANADWWHSGPVFRAICNGSAMADASLLSLPALRNQSLVPRVQFWSTRWEFLAFAGLQVMPCMAMVSILQMLPANPISTHAISMSVWVPKGRLPLVPMLIDGIQGPFLGQSVMAVPWQTLHFCLFSLCLHHHLFHRDHYQHGPLCHLPGEPGLHIMFFWQRRGLWCIA